MRQATAPVTFDRHHLASEVEKDIYIGMLWKHMFEFARLDTLQLQAACFIPPLIGQSGFEVCLNKRYGSKNRIYMAWFTKEAYFLCFYKVWPLVCVLAECLKKSLLKRKTYMKIDLIL